MKEKSIYYLIVADLAMGIYFFELIAFALFTGSVMLLCLIALLLLMFFIRDS